MTDLVLSKIDFEVVETKIVARLDIGLTAMIRAGSRL